MQKRKKRPPHWYFLHLDGFEATEEIRQWEETNLKSHQRRIPIVALSANVMSNVASKCLESGFSTYISKPVNFAILSDVIRSYLLPEGLLHIA
jgi:CheY-like chemotaxis protein